ncbi:Transmembrane O-methyltransferase [Collichthys lucidus]|uniref:catechol O-methyltransferase n=1 Tax=Collichthys lucidus TaxID=240159 RepID=A0A4U5UFG0_COLLU|nr:Transmembrane O-methyltransferase [Collichthys lucidus]
MWLMVASVPLLPAIIMVSSRYRVKVAALCRRALAWTLRLMRGKVCVRSTHAFVFSRCTHGKADSVLATFDLYADTHPSFCISPQIAEALDEVVRRVCPSRVLELGMHCGYTSVRLLRLLPPAGRLLTVELDPITADIGEEIILVAGFKHSQFQVLTSSSAEAIPTLRPYLAPDKETRTKELEGLKEIMDHIRARPDCYSIKSELQFMMEIFYRKGNTGMDR